jgi:hypothetical protein
MSQDEEEVDVEFVGYGSSSESDDDDGLYAMPTLMCGNLHDASHVASLSHTHTHTLPSGPAPRAHDTEDASAMSGEGEHEDDPPRLVFDELLVEVDADAAEMQKELNAVNELLGSYTHTQVKAAPVPSYEHKNELDRFNAESEVIKQLMLGETLDLGYAEGEMGMCVCSSVV